MNYLPLLNKERHTICCQCHFVSMIQREIGDLNLKFWLFFVFCNRYKQLPRIRSLKVLLKVSYTFCIYVIQETKYLRSIVSLLMNFALPYCMRNCVIYFAETF